jgi:hypothetical protein
MTDYATVYDTEKPMAERRDALCTVGTDFGVLPERFSNDLRRVLAHMPFAGPDVMAPGLRIGSYRDGLDGQDVLDTLRALAVTLLTNHRERERLEDELHALKADVAAARRVFGLAPGGDLDDYGRDAQ